MLNISSADIVTFTWNFYYWLRFKNYIDLKKYQISKISGPSKFHAWKYCSTCKYWYCKRKETRYHNTENLLPNTTQTYKKCSSSMNSWITSRNHIQHRSPDMMVNTEHCTHISLNTFWPSFIRPLYMQFEQCHIQILAYSHLSGLTFATKHTSSIPEIAPPWLWALYMSTTL